MTDTVMSLDLDGSGVTSRERDVLALLGERLTNAEIGDRLFISVRTVESHVSSLLTKLNLTNRRELSGLALTARRRGFPVQSTSLIGRDTEQTRVSALLVENRLVTLTGAAGSGKTRLAMEVGSHLAGEFTEGAVFVDLVPVTEPELVSAATAKALAPPGEVNATEADVISHLSRREVLIVLDNCEHVLDGAARLLEMTLTHCPRVKILTTSRQPIGLSSEWIFPVPPLSLPDDRSPPEASEAVRLLEERTAAIRPDLDLVGEHLQEAVEICRLLDGLPLALELAAVQMAYLTPGDVLRRLGNRFHLLVSHSGARESKTNTLRTAIDWSYELLDSKQRVVFNRLGVFTGGFSLTAAERVAAGDDISPDEVADQLASLVWRSMVVPIKSRETSRFRLLETMKAYALQQLEEGSQTWERLCEWAILEAEKIAPKLTGPDARVPLNLLDQESGNLRSALRWAIDAGRTFEAARLVATLWRYWHMRGNIAEGRRWVGEVLDMEHADSSTRLPALEAAGGLAWWGGDMDASRNFYEEALQLTRPSGDKALIANAAYNLAFPMGYSGFTEQGLAAAEEARALYEILDDEAGVAKALWAWGVVAHRAGRESEARSAYEEAISLLERLEDHFGLAWAYRMLGTTLINLGEPDQAIMRLSAGMKLFEDVGDLSGVVLHLRDFAQLAINAAEDERAMTLVGCLKALEEETAVRLVDDSSEQLTGLSQVEERLGHDRTEELLDRGRNMSRRQAVRFALDIRAE